MRFFWNSVGVEGNPKSNVAAGAGGAEEEVGIWIERSADLPRLWKGSRVCAGSGGMGRVDGLGRVEG